MITRSVTLGQAVERATDAFKIADTSHVWVSLDLYEKDLARVHVGQEVEMRTDSRPGERSDGARRVHRPGHRRGDAHREGAARVPQPERASCTPGQLVTARILGDPKLRRRARCWPSRAARSSRSKARPSCS